MTTPKPDYHELLVCALNKMFRGKISGTGEIVWRAVNDDVRLTGHVAIPPGGLDPMFTPTDSPLSAVGEVVERCGDAVTIRITDAYHLRMDEEE